jgi:benzodiazapine receptor
MLCGLCAHAAGFGMVSRSHASPQVQRTPLLNQRSSAMITMQETKELDSDAVIKYGSAVVAQMAAITATFGAIDAATDALLGGPLPWQAVTVFFWGMSLKSRVFSPLDNARPDLNKAVEGEKTRGFNDRTMPSWTPPGVTFPIMWVLIVGPLRAFSSTLVWEATGMHLLSPVLLCLMLHLSIGDTWNTVNNVERRLGAAVPGVTCVWASVLFASSQYYAVSELAGSLLALTAVWITVAGLLIADTWRINSAESGGKWEGEPLYPYKGEVTTKFFFD